MRHASPLAIAVTAALVILAVGCRSATRPTVSATPCVATQPRPSTWPANVTGCWIQPSIDTYAEFRLVQQGSLVTGVYLLCGAIAPCTLGYRVTGTASLPNVVLHWTEQNGQTYDETFTATLPPDADSLAGTIAVNGGTPDSTRAFYRASAQ